MNRTYIPRREEPSLIMDLAKVSLAGIHITNSPFGTLPVQ
jgi:hypothetical protein